MAVCGSLCGVNKPLKMDDHHILKKLEAAFQTLRHSKECNSLLKKYLTAEVFDKLKTRKTQLGGTLLDVISSGVEHLDSVVGIYAPDAESYSVFSDLFDPIIQDYHGFGKTDKHPPKNFGNLKELVNLDPEAELVISTRISCRRSLEGYPSHPCLTEAIYREIEGRITAAFESLAGEFSGVYTSLTGKTDVEQDCHHSKFLQAANVCRYFPTGRGAFVHDTPFRSCHTCINDEDHLTILVKADGGPLASTFKQMVVILSALEKKLRFSHSARLGYLTLSPTDIGTGIDVSVHIKLSKGVASFQEVIAVASRFNLEIRGTVGKRHSILEGGVYEVSNKRMLGVTEFQAIKDFQEGLKELIRIEKSL